MIAEPPPAGPTEVEPPLAAAAAEAAEAEAAAAAAAAVAAAAEPAAVEAAAEPAAGCVGASSWLSPLLPLPELSIRKGLRSKHRSFERLPLTTTEEPLNG